MSLKDKRNQLAQAQQQNADANSSEPVSESPKESLRSSLKERQKALAEEVARQNQLKNAVEQGESFYKAAFDTADADAKESSLLSAKQMFEAAIGIDENSPLAREGLVRVLNAFAAEAKRTKRYKMALDYYQRLKDDFQEPTAEIQIDEVKRLMAQDARKRRIQWVGGGVIAFFLMGLIFIQSLHLIAWPQDVCNGFGGNILCTPTPTNTPTLPPTFTPTLPPTITPTLPPTLTPTPIVYQARITSGAGLVAIYESPLGINPVKFLNDGDFVYLCAKDAASERYLISLDYCFNSLRPLGWVSKKFIVLTFPGDLPEILVTPSK